MGYSRGPRKGYAGAYTSTITNRPTCGGDKKAGTPPKIGVPANILGKNFYSANPPNCCGLNKCCYFKPGTNNKVLNNGCNNLAHAGLGLLPLIALGKFHNSHMRSFTSPFKYGLEVPSIKMTSRVHKLPTELIEERHRNLNPYSID